MRHLIYRNGGNNKVYQSYWGNFTQMSEEVESPVKISLKSGLSPTGAIICLVIGVGMVIPGLVYLPFIGITIFGVCIVLVGAFGPRGFYKFTRLTDGILYQRRYQKFFFPYTDIQNVLFDFQPTHAVHHYRNGMYVGSTAHSTVRIVFVLPSEQVPIQLASNVQFNKNRAPPDPKSLEVKVVELRNKWLQVLSKPTSMSQEPGRTVI